VPPAYGYEAFRIRIYFPIDPTRRSFRLENAGNVGYSVNEELGLH
jgi:hypothetical protein